MPLLWLIGLFCASSPAPPPAPPVAAEQAAPLSFPAGTPIAEVRAALAAHPEGVALKLAKGPRAWTGDEVEALVHKSPEARNLRALDLSGNPVGSAGAMAIAASPHLGALRSLDLSGCRIAEAGARGLAYSEGLAALETLRVDAKDPGPRGLEELKARFGAKLVLN
ncbi:MAG: hypothetical protein ACOZNI_22755 [Myxococcota bacterium]